MASDWYFMDNEQMQGPITPVVLQQLASQGRITPTTQVTKGTSGPWVAAMKVKGLSFRPPTAPVPPPPNPIHTTTQPASLQNVQIPTNQEQLIWSGRPSQIVHLGAYVLCGLTFWIIIPVFVALWKWLTVRCIKYELTNQRFRKSHGVLSRRTDELELYRVKDTTLVEPLFLRLFSLGSIKMTTSDMSTPFVTIGAIPIADAKQLRETIRVNVEQLRDRKRVREIDTI